MTPLNPRQKRFVEEYLVDLNAAHAAGRAGYSMKSRKDIGHALLRRPEVAAAIQRAMHARSTRTQITADSVVRELGLLAFANMDDYTAVIAGRRIVATETLPREKMAAVADYRIEGDKSRVKLHNKHAALVTLGEHLGLFNRKLELTGKVTLEQLVLDSMGPEGQEIEAIPTRPMLTISPPPEPEA